MNNIVYMATYASWLMHLQGYWRTQNYCRSEGNSTGTRKFIAEWCMNPYACIGQLTSQNDRMVTPTDVRNPVVMWAQINQLMDWEQDFTVGLGQGSWEYNLLLFQIQYNTRESESLQSPIRIHGRGKASSKCTGIEVSISSICEQEEQRSKKEAT